MPACARQRPVGLWLLAMAAMILVMVVLGGATRLTGSGLSIMEWAPLSGALPPLSDAEWHRLYDLYRQIPQYALVNRGFGLAGFKHIFWLEWVHRLWGRLLGLAFLVPLLWFAATRRIDRALALRLAALFVLGGLQGAVGWFMVASGFAADSTAVSQYRLVAHLALALALYAAVLWTALGLLGPAPAIRPGSWSAVRATRRLAVAASVALALTILAGGFVAGLHAGLIDNTFPLMDGRLVPPSYAALSPWPRNLFENLEAVQFDHRALATATVLLVLATLATGLAAGPPRRIRHALYGLAACAAVQYGLGVATLLMVVPIPLAVAHQAVAALLLGACLNALHALRGAPASIPEPVAAPVAVPVATRRPGPAPAARSLPGPRTAPP